MTRSPWLLTFGDLLTLILVLFVVTKGQNHPAQETSIGYQQDPPLQSPTSTGLTLLGTAFANSPTGLEKQTLVKSIGFSETELNKIGVAQRLAPILAILSPTAMAQIVPCSNLLTSSWQDEDDRTLTIAAAIRDIRPDITREIIVSDRGCDATVLGMDSTPVVQLDLIATDFATNVAANEPR